MPANQLLVIAAAECDPATCDAAASAADDSNNEAGVLDSSAAWIKLAAQLPADIPEQPTMVKGGTLREYQMQVGGGWGSNCSTLATAEVGSTSVAVQWQVTVWKTLPPLSDTAFASAYVRLCVQHVNALCVCSCVCLLVCGASCVLCGLASCVAAQMPAQKFHRYGVRG